MTRVNDDQDRGKCVIGVTDADPTSATSEPQRTAIQRQMDATDVEIDRLAHDFCGIAAE